MGAQWSSVERDDSLSGQHTSGTDVAGEEVASRRGTVRQEELDEFQQELERKRTLRQETLAALKEQLRELRERVAQTTSQKEQAEKEREELKSALKTQEEGSNSVALKTENEITEKDKRKTEGDNSREEELREELAREKMEKRKVEIERDLLKGEIEEKASLQRQVQALKDVSEIGKEMLRIRELQVKELKKKLVEVNISSVMAPPEDLRVEYEKQIENIRKLRSLYEERAAATLVEHRKELEKEEAKITVLETKLRDLQKETDEFKEAKKDLTEKIEALEKNLQYKENELETTKEDLMSMTVQNQSLNSQMRLINNLFSQMLVSPKVDLDRLTRLLKENHGLITDLTLNGDSNEVAALLVDLAAQVDKEQTKDENDSQEINENIESDISSNLTKVWKVMVELLSHQSPSHTELAGGAESCYKCVQTPSGPRSVISVSQTFLTLKDLILEKNHLVKEVGRLKTLNDHLEHRLGNQEKRLSVVTTELRKTWGVVNKLKAQHKQLHTHEKILRYELQQKRCMLTELKQELECCRDKWEKAREKNSQTEEDWKKLRKEFASRKCRKESNSAESGYEEEEGAHSPTLEAVGHEFFCKIRPFESKEQETTEDDIDHSDGNSFDTVIDLLEIAYIENQSENESGVPFVLHEGPSVPSEISPNLLPLTGSEFTEGLDQIESEDLAAVLDLQYQNQLIGVDYNLSLPSSNASSPVPTENDDFASSEMEISEEDSSSNSNNLSSLTSCSPSKNNVSRISSSPVPSDSSNNISKFLDGLLVENQNDGNTVLTSNKLSLTVPNTFTTSEESGSATPLVGEANSFTSSRTPVTNMVGENIFVFPVESSQKEASEEKGCKRKTEKKVFPKNHAPCTSKMSPEQKIKFLGQPLPEQLTGACSQEEILTLREERLKKLEAQCRSLVNKVSSSSFRSDIISNKREKDQMCHVSSDYMPSVKSDLTNSLSQKQEGKENNETSFASRSNSRERDLLLPVEHSCTSDTSLTTRSNIPSEAKLCASQSIGALSESSIQTSERTPEQILEARAARLKRLEDQCKSLFSKMSATSSRSDLISNKLDELHSSYGPPEEKADRKPLNETILPEKTQETIELPAALSDLSNCNTFDIPSESKAVLNRCCLPGPSDAICETQIPTSFENRTPEQILEARAERFKRLEEQCKSLVSKMTATSLRSEIISNKLDELHSCYGSSEDASDCEDHSLSKSEVSRKPTPTSSPVYARKINRIAEEDTQIKLNAAAQFSDVEERIPQETNTVSNSEKSVCLQFPNTKIPTQIADNTPVINMESSNKSDLQCIEVSATCQNKDPNPDTLKEPSKPVGQETNSNQTIQPDLQASSSVSTSQEEIAASESSNGNTISQIKG